MSVIAVNTITDASGGSTAQINGATPTVHNTMGRNRIINGDMRIDQRNAGAAVTTHGQFVTDRWNEASTNGSASGISIQQSTTVPSSAGFTNSLSYSVTTGGSVGTSGSYGLQQRIEGYNFADILSGSANAKQFTLSFWVRSSVTGTYGISFRNSAKDRSYIASYTVNSANTWEYKSITITADTSGTWLTTNGIGLDIFFDLGAGSNSSTTANSWQSGNYIGLTGGVKLVETSGAIFYITGVQLEVGSVATEFERRPYGLELALCQRYFFTEGATSVGSLNSASKFNGTVKFPVTMRSTPSVSQTGTITVYGPTFSDFSASAPSLYNVSPAGSARVVFNTGSGGSPGQATYIYNTGILSFSAEL